MRARYAVVIAVVASGLVPYRFYDRLPDKSLSLAFSGLSYLLSSGAAWFGLLLFMALGALAQAVRNGIVSEFKTGPDLTPTWILSCSLVTSFLFGIKVEKSAEFSVLSDGLYIDYSLEAVGASALAFYVMNLAVSLGAILFAAQARLDRPGKR